MDDQEIQNRDNSETAADEVARPSASVRSVPIPTHPAEIAPSPGAILKACQCAFEEIHLERGTIPAEDDYAAEVREQAFLSFYGALANACAQIVYDEYPESDYTKRNRPLSKRSMRVVASAPGSDSSTLAKAFAVALTRLNEDRPYPLGCVFVVHRIATAEAVFLELSLLFPNAVAVFSKQHDAESAQTQKYPNTVRVGELEKYPVLVVTHDFYMGSRGEQARNYTNGDLKLPRVVTFIDERSNEIAARVPGMVLLVATADATAGASSGLEDTSRER